MARVPFRQGNFSGGYLSPQLYGRVDTEKYRAGLAEARNCVIQRNSTIFNRSGFKYCGPIKTNNGFQMVPFVLSAYNSYELEVGAGYVRIWKNQAPLSVGGCPGFAIGTHYPAGTVLSYGGAYYYKILDQYGLAPSTITITSGSGYVAGSVVTLTSSAAVFTQTQVYTSAVVKFQTPGGIIVTATMQTYTSNSVVTATIDAAVPTSLQNAATLYWTLTTQVLNQPNTITISTATTYAAGQVLTLTASATISYFTAEMATFGQIIYFPSSAGIIAFTVTTFVSATVIKGTANIAIPAALQATPTIIYNTPQTIFYQTFTPSTAVAMQILSTGAGYGPGVTVALASSGVWSAGSVGQQYTLSDALGNSVTVVVSVFTNANSVSAVTSGPVPASLQATFTNLWTTWNYLPGTNSLYWYALPVGVAPPQFEIPTAMLQPSIGTIVYAQINSFLTMTSQAFAPVQLLRFSDYQWQLNNYAPSAGISAPTITNVQGTQSTTHTFLYAVTAVSALTGVESLASNPASFAGNYPTPTLPNIITWSAVQGAKAYNIYCLNGNTAGSGAGSGVPGLIGSVTNFTSFNDIGIIAIATIQPPVQIPFLQTVNDYPAVCSIYQQRLLMGNTVNQPQTIYGSRVGQIANLNVSTPLVDSDAVQVAIASNVVQFIMSFVDIGTLIIHTSAGEYKWAGNVNGAITPLVPNIVRQGSHGASAVQPITVGNTDIYVQRSGQIVNDLRFDIQVYQFDGKDLTEYVPDLFIGRTVVQMAWQQNKNSVLWMVMSDGALLSMTYKRDEGIVAWNTHDTGSTDFYTQVSVIPEGAEDAVYVGVARSNGTTFNYFMERLAQRDFIDVNYLTDAYFADCYTVYDGRNTGTQTITVTTSNDWTPASVFTLTASVSGIYARAPAGSQIILRQVNAQGLDTVRLYFTVANNNLGFGPLTCTTNAPVPTWAQNVPLTAWGTTITSLAGLTLPNYGTRPLSILADGFTIASPNNPLFTNQYTSTNGRPFPNPAMVVVIGLPITASMTTLPLENQRGDSITSKQKSINNITMQLYQTNSFRFAQVCPVGNTQRYVPWKQRSTDMYAYPTALNSRINNLNAPPSDYGNRGDSPGQTVYQQLDPVPFGVASINIDAEVGN